VTLCLFGTGLITGPLSIPQMRHERVWSSGWVLLTGENRRIRREACPTATLPTTNLCPGHEPGTVRSRRLTAYKLLPINVTEIPRVPFEIQLTGYRAGVSNVFERSTFSSTLWEQSQLHALSALKFTSFCSQTVFMGVTCIYGFHMIIINAAIFALTASTNMSFFRGCVYFLSDRNWISKR
jgi:hypothetical protein